jgi:hypothetical protein
MGSLTYEVCEERRVSMNHTELDLRSRGSVAKFKLKWQRDSLVCFLFISPLC